MPKKQKRLVFSHHALQRMRERGFSRQDVALALQNRDIVTPNPGGGSQVKSKCASRPIKVVIREFHNRIVVITVMPWDRQ